jgi:hypothetical protein
MSDTDLGDRRAFLRGVAKGLGLSFTVADERLFNEIAEATAQHQRGQQIYPVKSTDDGFGNATLEKVEKKSKKRKKLFSLGK